MRQLDPETLRAELDRCVKCGMCLDECPTYRLAGNESESPRGRIALIEGLTQGTLPGDPAIAQAHLAHCLGCRRCERVCPSGVRYGAILDQVRNSLPRGGLTRLAALAQSPGMQRVAARVARALPPAISAALPGLGRMHRLARALPSPEPPPAPGLYPARAGRVRGRIGLFAGCTGAAQQPGALHAALRLLGHAGYEVLLPAGRCCGALAWHAGRRAAAEDLAAANRSTFDCGLDAIVSIASGCGIHLDDYEPALPAPHSDISRFLLEQGGLESGDFAPLARTVHLHTPCSVENLYRGAHWADALLRLIPGLELVRAGVPGQCCGSAGDYMLRYPQTAARLRQPIIDQLHDVQRPILLSGNVGCAMHIAEGLQAAGQAAEVMHPVELLARQLRQDTASG